MSEYKPLGHINYGAIDIYCGLKFETKLDFDELSNVINERIERVYEKYSEYIKKSMQEDLSKEIYERELEQTLCVKNADNNRIVGQIKDHKDLKEEICGIELDFTNKGFNMRANTLIDNYLAQMTNICESDIDFAKDIYGEVFLSAHKRLILPPIKITLVNGETVLLSALLYIFRNDTAILRITLPINNLDSQCLMTNQIDNYIQSAETIYGFPLKLADKSKGDIQDCYCRFLAEIQKVKSVIRFKEIDNIILASHSDMFENIKEIPDNLKEAIYKISVSPIQERKGVDYQEEAKQHFERNGYFFNGIGFVLSSMGRCVSIADNTVVDFLRHHLSEKEGVSDKQVFSKLIDDIRRNIEFAIIILLLKNVSNDYMFEQKTLGKSNLSEVKRNYNKDKIFISLLQNGVYGSVREAINAFEENMIYFLDVKNEESKIGALNNILEEEQAERMLLFQNVISIVGLIFTLIFGLPSINETLTYIRKLCHFINHDIPYITVENCSFFIWCLMIIAILIFIFGMSNARRKRNQLIQ